MTTIQKNELSYLEQQLEQLEDFFRKTVECGSQQYRKACYMYNKLIEQRNSILG